MAGPTPPAAKPKRNTWLIPVLIAALTAVVAVIAVVALTQGSDEPAVASQTTAPTAAASTSQSDLGSASAVSGPSDLRLVTPLRADEVIAAQPAGLVVLDVRTPSEFADGSLSGAINIDRFDPAFADHLNRLDKNAPYVVYCRTGNRSSEATAVMADLGFTNVYEINGGILAWSGAGLPVGPGSASSSAASATTTSAVTTTVSPYRWSYVGGRYPETGSQDPAFSGCSPGTPTYLPDGVWYGFAQSWTNTEIVVDLACVTWVYDSTCSCERPEITNNNDLLRDLRFSPDALGYGLSGGVQTGPMTVIELISNPGNDIGAHRYANGVELVISVNNGLVTEIAIPNHS